MPHEGLRYRIQEPSENDCPDNCISILHAAFIFGQEWNIFNEPPVVSHHSTQKNKFRCQF